MPQTVDMRLAEAGARMHARADAIARISRLLQEPVAQRTPDVLRLLFPLTDVSTFDDCDLLLVAEMPQAFGVHACGNRDVDVLRVVQRAAAPAPSDNGVPLAVVSVGAITGPTVGWVLWGWTPPRLTMGVLKVDPADADDRIDLVGNALKRVSLIPF